MNRRRIIQSIAALLGSLSLPRRRLRAAPLSAGEEATLNALAEVTLPGELGAEGRTEVVERFASWLRRFEPGADLGHGYGLTKLMRAATSPAGVHSRQLSALDAQARSRHGRPYAQLEPADRRAIAADALKGAGVEALPARPDGGHVVSDLMGFYFRSSEANDLCYRAAIGRDLCAGLPGTVKPPPPLRRQRG